MVGHYPYLPFVGGAVLLNAGVFQMRRCSSATTAHRALPVCEWPALGVPLGNARSNAASAVFTRCGWVALGLQQSSAGGLSGMRVDGGWRFSEEAVLGNHSAQSTASV